MNQIKWSTSFQKYLNKYGIYNFSPWEFCIVGRKPKANSNVRLKAPPIKFWMNMIPTAIRIQQLRIFLCNEIDSDAVVKVNSSWRDLDYNAEIGSNPGSLHTVFNACDIYSPGIETNVIYDYFNNLEDSKRFGLGFYGTFVHIDTRGYLEEEFLDRVPRNARINARWGPLYGAG